MFQNEYRKVNDSIHAPKELLDVIKAESEDSEFTFSRPVKQKWPMILGYSGLAAAAAVLAILVIRPFHIGKMAAPKADAAVMTESAVEEQKAVLAGGFSASTYSDSAAPASLAMDSLSEARLEKTDGDEDEYYYFNNVEDPTYEDVFSMLLPSTSDAGTPEETENAAVSLIPGSSVSFRIEDGTVYFPDRSIPIPDGRTVKQVVEDRGIIYLISEAENFVYATVYDQNEILGETKQSGSYRSYEIKDTSVFDDDYSLSDHHVLLIESFYAPDLSKADISDPVSYCPSFADAEGERVLYPDEITCLTEGNGFAVYGAVETTDSVHMLYIFAELGE